MRMRGWMAGWAAATLWGAGSASAQVLEGRVVDGRSDLPVPGAEVVLLDAALHPAARLETDSDGRWRVADRDVGPEVVHIGVSAPGYATWLSAPLAPGTSPLEVRLVRAGDPPPVAPTELSAERVASWCGPGLDPATQAVVVGRVLDRRTGDGLAGVDAVADWGGAETPRLVIGARGGPPTRLTASGDDGLYLFCGLPAARPMALSARAGGLPADTVRVTLEPGSVQRVDLTLDLTRPGEPAAVFGTVVDERTRAPVAGVRIEVADGRRMALTNERGFFVLDSVASGLQILTARHLAYADRELPVVLEPGRTGEIRLELTTAPVELAPLTVTVWSRKRLRDMQLFDHRRALGFGTFFTSEELERRRPWVLGDLLHDTPGLQVRRAGAFGPISVRSRGRTCTPAVWVDGRRWRAGDPLTEILGQELQAVEVHKGVPPPEFYPGACVTVVAWTKRGR